MANRPASPPKRPPHDAGTHAHLRPRWAQPHPQETWCLLTQHPTHARAPRGGWQSRRPRRSAPRLQIRALETVPPSHAHVPGPHSRPRTCTRRSGVVKCVCEGCVCGGGGGASASLHGSPAADACPPQDVIGSACQFHGALVMLESVTGRAGQQRAVCLHFLKARPALLLLHLRTTKERERESTHSDPATAGAAHRHPPPHPWLLVGAAAPPAKLHTPFPHAQQVSSASA